MSQGILKTASTYLEFYVQFVADGWHNITYWQYIALMVTGLLVGYLWMSKGASGRV